MGELTSEPPTSYNAISRDSGHASLLATKGASSRELSPPHISHSTAINMGDIAAIIPSSQDTLLKVGDIESNLPTPCDRDIYNTPPKVAHAAVSTPNPFREGKAAVKFNMAPEMKKANIARELLEADSTSNDGATHHGPRTSTSATYMTTKPAFRTANRSTVKTNAEEAEVKTIYNPAALNVPIRIYVAGNDPTYVEPVPLQWNKKSAELWEEEKAAWIKRGIQICDVLKGPWRSTRGTVIYWEWIVKGRFGDRIKEWILYRENTERAIYSERERLSG